MDFHQTVCALLLWRYTLGLLIGKFVNFWQLSAQDMSVFSFLDNNFSKCQWIFTKLCVCIDIMDIAMRLLMAEFCLFLTELSARNTFLFYFQDNNLSKSQWIFTTFDVCIDSVEICCGIAHQQISSIFDRVICPWYNNDGVLSFHILFPFKLYWHLWISLLQHGQGLIIASLKLSTIDTVLFVPHWYFYYSTKMYVVGTH